MKLAGEFPGTVVSKFQIWQQLGLEQEILQFSGMVLRVDKNRTRIANSNSAHG